jgi:hypothetical protein
LKLILERVLPYGLGKFLKNLGTRWTRFDFGKRRWRNRFDLRREKQNSISN